MPTKKDNLQDDYYASLNSSGDTSEKQKKVLKIKKPLIKKVTSTPKADEDI